MEKSEEKRLLIRAMVRNAIDKRNEANKSLEFWQKECEHTHLEATHRRSDGYGEKSEFFTDFRCHDCGKQWTEEGTR